METTTAGLEAGLPGGGAWAERFRRGAGRGECPGPPQAEGGGAGGGHWKVLTSKLMGFL